MSSWHAGFWRNAQVPCFNGFCIDISSVLPSLGNYLAGTTILATLRLVAERETEHMEHSFRCTLAANCSCGPAHGMSLFLEFLSCLSGVMYPILMDFMQILSGKSISVIEFSADLHADNGTISFRIWADGRPALGVCTSLPGLCDSTNLFFFVYLPSRTHCIFIHPSSSIYPQPTPISPSISLRTCTHSLATIQFIQPQLSRPLKYPTFPSFAFLFCIGANTPSHVTVAFSFSTASSTSPLIPPGQAHLVESHIRRTWTSCSTSRAGLYDHYARELTKVRPSSLHRMPPSKKRWTQRDRKSVV